MTFEEIKKEYERQIIGDKLYQLVKDVCTRHIQSDSSILRFWDEDSLGGMENQWDPDLADRIIAEFVIKRLLSKEDRVFKYIFAEAQTVESVEKLVNSTFSFFIQDHLRASGIGNVISRLNGLVRAADLGTDIQVRKKGAKIDEYILAARSTPLSALPFTGDLNELVTFSNASHYSLILGAPESENRPILVSSSDMVDWMNTLLHESHIPIYYRDIKALFIREFKLASSFVSTSNEKVMEEPDRSALIDVHELQNLWETLSRIDRVILAFFDDFDKAMKVLNRQKSALYEKRKILLRRLAQDIDGTNEEVAHKVQALIEHAVLWAQQAQL